MSLIVEEWSRDVPLPPEAVWPVVSDTDRLNRSLALGLSFDERRLEDGELVRTGSIRRFGLTISWIERDFAFQAPRSFAQERLYQNGPVVRTAVSCRIEPIPSGSRVVHRLEVQPRSRLLRPIVLADHRLSTRPAFERSLAELGRLLSGEPNAYDPPPPPLRPEALERLDAGLDGVQSGVARRLREHITGAAVERQARIRPLELAEQMGRPADEVIAEFLRAVHDGALEMGWELLCPSCRAPKRADSTLSLDLETHCVSCNVRYDATFPDSVDVVFRPHRQIREVELDVACLLSPARTPHVLLQEPIASGETVTRELDLEVGGHRIDSVPWFGGASLEVREDFRSDRITADLTTAGVRPTAFRVRPGRIRLVVRNRMRQEVAVKVERVRRPPYTLTAGRLLEVPGAADLLPVDALSPGVRFEVRVCTVVALRRWTEGPTETHLRTFDTEPEVLQFLRTYRGLPAIGLAVAQGPVVELIDQERTVPAGQVVECCLDLLQAAGGGRIRVDASADLAGAVADFARVVGRGEGWIDLRPRVVDEALAQAAEGVMDLPPLQTLGGYRVVGELARGGMGRVLEAVDAEGNPVVVKTLFPEWQVQPEHVQRFFNEAYVTHLLRHPNIVRVLDYGMDGESVYMVLERVQGEELAAVAARGHLSVGDVVRIGRQVATALQVAHDRGVVHRDVKPRNLLIQPDGSVKLIDFGIAVEVGEEDASGESKLIVGSPAYMSPEQVLASPLDGRSDQYSLAVVIFEMLTGANPFDGDDARSLALARVYAQPHTLAERGAADVPIGLAAVIERALETSVEDRFPDAVAFASALETSF